MLSRTFCCPFYLEIRDLWPDALAVRGLLKAWQAWLLEKLALSLYRSAIRINCLTPGIRQEFIAKRVAADRIDVFPNAYDRNLFSLPSGTRQNIREKLGWKANFVAVYAGTHTPVTAIDCIVRAANELRERADIRIDLFGSGQSKQPAIDLASQLELKNIHFHDPIPKASIPEILAAADVGIMTLFKSPLAHIYFENKLIDYMASGLPILAAMDGLQPGLIARVGAGYCVPATDHVGLAELIKKAADDLNHFRSMGEKGRVFVQTELTQEIVLSRYVLTLESLASGTVSSTPAWDPLNLC
jgi:glycosyltransferase involved in cell wall biosynthesis